MTNHDGFKKRGELKKKKVTEVTFKRVETEEKMRVKTYATFTHLPVREYLINKGNNDPLLKQIYHLTLSL